MNNKMLFIMIASLSILLICCPFYIERHLNPQFPVTLNIINKTHKTIVGIALYKADEMWIGAGNIYLIPDGVHHKNISSYNYDIICTKEFIIRYSTLDDIDNSIEIEGLKSIILPIHNEKEWTVTIIIKD